MTVKEAQAQRTEALAAGNAVRCEMAQVKRQIKAGQIDAASVIETCELPIKVVDILTAIPRVGEGKALRFMGSLELTSLAALGGKRTANRQPITERQREELVSEVGSRLRRERPWATVPERRHGSRAATRQVAA